MSNVSEGVEKAKAYASETASVAKAKVSETVAVTKAKASEAYDTTKVKAADAYDTSRAKVDEALEATRRGAATATRKAGEAVQENPLTVLIGGLALGALAGALLPKTRREDDLLGNVGRKVNQTATEAAKAARTAGAEQLDELGINKDAAKSQVSALFDGVVQAAGSAGTAAAKTVTPKA